jgi:hypothetical protein
MSIERKELHFTGQQVPGRDIGAAPRRSSIERKELNLPIPPRSSSVMFRLTNEYIGVFEYKSDNGFELYLRKTHFTGTPPAELSICLIGLTI